MRARAKSSKKSALFFAFFIFFSFFSFFSFFILFQLFFASKHTFKTPKLLTDLQAEKTEKADREIRSPEPKRGSQKGKTPLGFICFQVEHAVELCSIFNI